MAKSESAALASIGGDSNQDGSINLADIVHLES